MPRGKEKKENLLGKSEEVSIKGFIYFNINFQPYILSESFFAEVSL